MGETFIINLGRESIYIILLVTAPFLLSSLFIGIFISIIQAVTQIQDMTITFVPKFFVLGLIMLLMGGWIFGILQDFTVRLISSIALFTH
ncbi:MAG: flagellar biosynthetic protein FliQ [Candidatus Margulisbacteria bacterium]|nr:flagellar biosynthetic protein FliQ [Candidatus Margulisiibacteriota bacterium]